MKLKDDMSSFVELFNTLSQFYGDKGRDILIFEEQFPTEGADSDYFIRFLVNKKNVCEYRISRDRGIFLSIVSLAIGPHYFSPTEFWDYVNSQRFSLEASTEAIGHNLALLDEFLRG